MLHLHRTYEYGPCIGLSRIERWEQARSLGKTPPAEVRNTSPSSFPRTRLTYSILILIRSRKYWRPRRMTRMYDTNKACFTNRKYDVNLQHTFFDGFWWFLLHFLDVIPYGLQCVLYSSLLPVYICVLSVQACGSLYDVYVICAFEQYAQSNTILAPSHCYS